ncbi:Chloride channel protein [uncultured Alphaproteobacteria bacterium]|uniref:Chloride channel protein n=1 Tax=uncultured Alphaproteobacteria bacterium TaxID=91750 RepID=A0A212JKV7_9PROT|nr:Chloride channel protein [uncultured Alphaproteobacteria bacterium]
MGIWFRMNRNPRRAENPSPMPLPVFRFRLPRSPRSRRAARSPADWWVFATRWFKRFSVWVGGIAVALVAILFAQVTEQAFEIFSRLLERHPALPFVITPLGLALAALVTIRLVPGAQGSGIPQTIAALSLSAEQRRAVLSLPIAAAKICLTAIGLASGASVGREGPTVQVGASLMLGFSRMFRLNSALSERSMTVAGGAAGIAAAFNTPLAGVVFAIEELTRSYETRTSGTVMTAVILSGITSLALVGNSPYFGHSIATLDIGSGWLAVGIIGIVGGAVGGLFSRLLIGASQNGLPGAIGHLARQRPVLFAAACGLALALIGVVSGNATYGTGYTEARTMLDGGSLGWLFFPLKVLATAVSYLSGIPGGLFSPSLSAGAGLGSVVARFVADVPLDACILLGMAAYFTGVVQSPITAAVIVMEMTSNHGMIVPLMAVSFLAFGVSRIVCPHPLYKALALRFLSRKSDPAPAKLRTDLSDEIEPPPPPQPVGHRFD